MEQDRKPRNKPVWLWLNYHRGDKNIQWRKDSLFNKYCWENSTTRCKKNEARQLLYTIYKNQFKTA